MMRWSSSRLCTLQVVRVKRPTYSMLKHGKGLPPNVHLLHLLDDGEGTIIFRLANIFQASACFELQAQPNSLARLMRV